MQIPRLRSCLKMPHLRDDASPPQFCAPTATGAALSENRSNRSKSWAGLVLRDPQFWVPMAVLAIGLVVLRWIS
jgi:hypothetical protein